MAEKCPRCERPLDPSFPMGCLECGHPFFMWYPIDSMDEPREEVVARRIERFKADHCAD